MNYLLPVSGKSERFSSPIKTQDVKHVGLCLKMLISSKQADDSSDRKTQSSSKDTKVGVDAMSHT